MTAQALIPSAADGITERFDPTACLAERVRHQAIPAQPTEPGRYIEIQGPDRTLLIPLAGEVTHVGRGLSADLRLDDSSVSRRHAILVPRPTGARILDDRSANGTFVNGRRVQQADLHGGDVIVLGRVVLRFLEL
jgi:pSer/pThr/pTyr-binding forkhead associated (FHA) protein